MEFLSLEADEENVSFLMFPDDEEDDMNEDMNDWRHE